FTAAAAVTLCLSWGQRHDCCPWGLSIRNRMGNEIAKKYEMDEEPSASGGLACLWKIYKAMDKATGNPVSVFVFTKEDLKDVDKALREQVLVILRRELKVLEGMAARKHPSVVRHIESFEETKKLLAFVTERVSCSLADAIGESPVGALPPAAASAARRGFERYEVARGFFGLCEGLQFVHTIRRRLHLNLAPESIFLAPSGQFKLGGFGFSVDLPSTGASSTPCPYFQTGARSGFEGTWRLHPVMAFSSPEATAPAGSSDVSCASDMFSLGTLMYQLCRDDPRTGRLCTADPTPQAHQTFCATLDYPGRVDVSSLFPEVQTLVASLVQLSPTARPLLGNVTINPMFHGKDVTVLKTIDGIPGRNPAEAATFLTSVRPAVSGFPLRVQRDCIMMPLMDACAAEPSGRLWAFALPIVTDVCERLDRREIISSVQAKFGPALKSEPLEALASLVAAIPLFLQKMEVTFFRSDVVPMVCRALQAQGNPQVRESTKKAMDVQEAALKAVADDAFHGAIDGKTRELAILPRVCWLVVRGTAVRVKVNALLCLSKTFHFLVVRAVVDKVLPTLKFCAERDETVAIQLCVLGCYDAIAKRLEKLGPVATHILPACTPMLACKGLNSNQFEMAVGIVQGMLETVIKYRREQIANPSATAIIENRPTHPGGEPDEAEIARQRAIVLGGWKEAPPTSSKPAPAAAASRPLSPVSASFPGSAPAPAPSSSSGGGGFDMADMWSAPPAPSSGSAGAQSGAFSRNLSPVSNSTAMPIAVSGRSGGGGGRGGSKSSGYGSASSAADMFQGLSVSDQSKGPATNGTAGGSSDPFASAGLGGAFGAASTGNAAPAGGGMSWMDGSFGGTGGAANSGSGGGISNLSPEFGGLSGLGGAAPGRAKAATSMGISPPPKPSASFSSRPPASGGGPPAGDPFAAFFDAAVAGGPGGGAANSPQRVASPSLGMMGAASGAPPAFLGGVGAGPASATTGGNGGGGSLEDQLAKTQREIAQLTRELGSPGNGMMVGLAAGGGMTAAMGGGAGGVGWSMPGAPAPAGGMGMPAWPGGGASSQKQPPAAAQQGQQHTNSTDPFAFLGEGGQQGGKGSGFDFFS
ncbi:unnamed protein product, partial [Ectocarpus sp. 12 AP-2014]